MKRKDVRPLVGYSWPLTVKKLEEMRALKGGNLLRGSLPADRQEALAVMRYCREHEIYVILGETVRRGYLSATTPFRKEDFDDFAAEAGEFLLGCFALGEAGGIFYWPKDYTVNQAAHTWKALEPSGSPAEAHEKAVRYYRDFVEFQKRVTGENIRVLTVESSQILQYQAEAGIRGFIHEMCPGSPISLLPAYRGAARAFHSLWGTHIAIGWYGGIHMDELWFRRWKMCLYLSFLQGAEVIYPESNHYNRMLDRWREDDLFDLYERDHPKMLLSRAILREFYRFTQIHQRPGNEPETPIGILFGNHEGAPNLWNPYAWGQYENGEHWEAGAAEDGWKLVSAFFRKQDIFEESVMGTFNHTGNPPAGQLDIVPFAHADLSHYRCLIFLGWNSMSAELHEKLVRFVEKGGRLLIFPAHFNIEAKRENPLKLFRNGDWRELCGIRVKGWKKKDTRGFKFITKRTATPYTLPYWGSRHDPFWLGKITPADMELEKDTRVLAGFSYHIREYRQEVENEPALLEHKLGRGVVWTVAVAEYPGDRGMAGFTRQLLQVISAGERPEIDVLAPEAVRYAIYDHVIDDSTVKTIYLLNTEPDHAQGVRIQFKEKVSEEIVLAPSEFRIAYLTQDALLFPPDPNLRLHGVRQAPGELALSLYSLTEQPVILHDFSGKKRKITCNGSEHVWKRSIEPGFEDVYADSFLKEPDIHQYPNHAPLVRITKKLTEP